MEINEEILNRLDELWIDCPDCENMGMDDEYTCTTCWSTGGDGQINVGALFRKYIKKDNSNHGNIKNMFCEH